MNNDYKCRFTVFFDKPFWVGIAEQKFGGKLSVSRVVFGQEPSEPEIYEFIIKKYHKLEFSDSVNVKEYSTEKINPKRLQREAAKIQNVKGVSTKAQEALRLQREKDKIVRKQKSTEQKELEKKLEFAKRQEKKKQKKKGH